MKDPRKEMIKKLKPLLKKYAPPLVAKKESDTGYELWSKKEIVIAGNMKQEIFFAAIIVQKIFVGFYYFPIYTHPEIKEKLSPVLLSLLKGKSCFHIKELNDELLEEIKNALQIGFDFYKKKGWV